MKENRPNGFRNSQSQTVAEILHKQDVNDTGVQITGVLLLTMVMLGSVGRLTQAASTVSIVTDMDGNCIHEP